MIVTVGEVISQLGKWKSEGIITDETPVAIRTAGKFGEGMEVAIERKVSGVVMSARFENGVKTHTVKLIGADL